MSEEKKNLPKGVNNAKDGPRYIDISIDVNKINKDFLTAGAKGGVYLHMKLIMKPDGVVDQYENLGFIAQVVPSKMYKANKELKGDILGNARENEWDKAGATASVPGVTDGEAVSQEAMDDLPF